MGDRIKVERQIEKKDETGVIIKTVTEDKYTFEDLLKIIPQQQQQLSKLVSEENQIKDYVEKKGWIKELEDYKKSKQTVESFIEIANSGLKDYLDKLEEEGRKKVEFLKKKEGYDRLPSDATEKASQVKNQILATVSQDLGLKDVGHPVMMRLREVCFKQEE